MKLVEEVWALSSLGIVCSLILYIVSLKVIKYGWFKAYSVFIYYLSFGHGFGPITWFIVYYFFPKNLRLPFGCITFIALPFGLYFIPKTKNIDEDCLTFI